MSKFSDALLFLREATRIHGDAYEYTKVTLQGRRVPVTILCRTHGEFQQTPDKHLLGRGCPQCGQAKHKPTLGQEKFLQRAIAKHGDRYDYSKANYTKSTLKVDIGCPEHGVFQQTPNDHWTGYGCPKCGVVKTRESLTYTQEQFIEVCQRKHGNRYDYSSVEYTKSSDRVTIICPEHGKFTQKATHHMMGSACPSCGVATRSAAQLKSEDKFLQEVIQKHGDKYDVSKVDYKGANRKVVVVCPKHGEFKITPHCFSVRGHGCPSCVSHYTKPHKEIESTLKLWGADFQSTVRNIIPPKELDIYIPSHSLAIEMNGVYWHSVTEKTSAFERNAHLDKFTACEKRGIQLLQINEFEWRDARTRDVWSSIIQSKLKRTRKVHARNTVFRPVSREEAQEFLELNHLQGAPLTPRWNFGLYLKNPPQELVGVISFSWHVHDVSLNLLRMAFKLNTTIVGGAHKLFKNALPLMPQRDIVTFSDNRYSTGAVYPLLGFHLNKKLSPSYQWFFRNKLLDKRKCRRKRLSLLLGSKYASELTEHQNMYRAGARCLYDAGYKRWVYQCKK